jgi:hypothetical protein
MSNGGGSQAAVHQKRDGAMPDSDDMSHEVDFSTPNVARIYDYYLGGKDNYAADREAARRVLGAAPDIPLAALENREFLKRAIQFLVQEQGIHQFRIAYSSPLSVNSTRGDDGDRMIGKISTPRGEHVQPLLYYLFGPGRMRNIQIPT